MTDTPITPARPPTIYREVAVKPLEWEDVDRGRCTKWQASALGGAYELVDFGKDDPGFAVNFYWGQPLSFWFIQGDPDEWGPTGPKMFPTLDEAKAAAQADYEARILSALTTPPAREISEAATHRHRKGGEYVLIGYGKMQAEGWTEEGKWLGERIGYENQSVDMREVAVYRSVADPTEMWVRPREEFEDGRFTALEAAHHD